MEGSHDTSKGSCDMTEESHNTTFISTLETNLRGPPILVSELSKTGRDMPSSPDLTLPDARRDVPGSPETESFDKSSYSDSLHDSTDSSHDPTDRPSNRAAILHTIYQHYIRDTKGSSGHIKGTRVTRKKVNIYLADSFIEYTLY